MKLAHNWKEKMFLIGGKEVLIKTLAQAILVYTMSCLMLLAKTCDEINRLCVRF